MLEIISVKRNSIAERVGIKVNDYLVSMNNQIVNDFIDYRFFQAEENLEIQIERKGKILSINVEKSYDDDLGIAFQDMEMRLCTNNCIFCFIKQNPPGMRKQIYLYDGDYRYSFLYGNFITLTNVDDNDLNRIVNQRLSPLYISVHATDPAVRKKIFRFRGDDFLMDKLEFLNRGRIELHIQIVLMPGINDGEILESTIKDLYHFRESIKSVAIVPVGLTKHRKRLPKIRGVDSKYASNLLPYSRAWNRNYFNIEGDYFVYLADEFYLLANRPLPGRNSYGRFYQIENGVGLVREFIDNFKRQVRKLPESIPEPKRVLFVTGTLVKPVLETYIISVLNSIQNLEVDVFPVVNKFFGETITVAGLITGRDIIEQLKSHHEYDLIYLPPRCINDDSLLLDNMTPEDIQRELGIPVKVSDENYMEMLSNVSI